MAARRGQFQSQAQADAALAFGGKRSALSEALGEAREQFHGAIQGGRTSAKLTRQAAAYAKPQVDQIYAGAQSALQAGQGRAEGVLGALPHDPVLDAYRATQAGAGQQQLANLLAAGASRKSHLQDIGTAAQAGAQFDESAARQQLLKSVTGILAKRQNVRGEEGAFAASEAGKLEHESDEAEAAERRDIRGAETSRANSEEGSRTSRANSEEGSRTSRANAREKGAGSTGGLPSGYQSKDKQDAAAEQVNGIRTAAGQYLKTGHKLSRGQLAERLEKGFETSGKTSSGTSYSHKIPSFNKGPLLNAALDEIEYGYVRSSTAKELHHRGYSLGAMGLNGPPSAAQTKALTGKYKKAFAPLTGHR